MKNTKKLIILIASCVVLIAIMILIYNSCAKKEISDAQTFSEEYTYVGEDNVFVYRTIDQIIQILEHGTGVVYLGFPECPWCQQYVAILNETAKEVGIDKIYYFDIKNERENDTEKYKKIVELLSDYLLYNDEGNKRVFVPDVTIVKDGEIIAHNNETSVVTEEDGTPEEYWTAQRKESLKIKLSNSMQEIVGNVCTVGCND